jgi:hypothetical protein
MIHSPTHVPSDQTGGEVSGNTGRRDSWLEKKRAMGACMQARSHRRVKYISKYIYQKGEYKVKR